LMWERRWADQSMTLCQRAYVLVAALAKPDWWPISSRIVHAGFSAPIHAWLRSKEKSNGSTVMKSLRSSVFAFMLSTALPITSLVPAHAQIAVDVSVEAAPPPLPYYEQPVIPAEGYIWVPGYWAWDPSATDYFWVPGTWVLPPQPELLWTPAYWGWDGGRYLFHPGYWGPEVGFYGGIDYGYGYTGAGYYGGHWDHGNFFYNRTVNNITNVRITNVYNQTVVVNKTIDRVSFNGGNGGTTARPTAQQEQFARERHVDPTPLQTQHVEAASRDRALFSKQNHGEPAVAATPRPGAMQGEGVTRASRTPVNPGATPGREPGAAEPHPGQETPHPAEMGREPPRPEERAPAAEPPRSPQEAPRVEPGRPAENREPPRPEPNAAPRVEPPRPEGRPAEPPRVEERSPPPRMAPQPPAARQPPPRMAPPRAAPPEKREEEKR
jgi:WXXGXW repeat (2 copies)